MNYLQFQEYVDAGGDEHEDSIVPMHDPYEGGRAYIEDQPTRGRANAYAASASKASAQDAHWNGVSATMKKMDYNGESIELPVVAPRSEKNVTIRKVILERTINTIENHSGGHRINWNWKKNVFNNHFMKECPAMVATAMQVLAAMNDLMTIAVYECGDVSLHGSDTSTALNMVDPLNPADFPANSRRDCRWLGLTFTFNPQAITTLGSVVARAQLPPASSLQIYVRAPQDAGGLHVNATKAVLEGANPENFFRVGGARPAFHAMRNGTVPLQDHFNSWWEDEKNHVYFSAMKQIAFKLYVGEDVATDSLKMRFMKINQRKWIPEKRKAEHLSVHKLQNEIMTLISETADMTPAQIQAEVPELSQLFFNALLDRVKTTSLARLTVHAAPSANIGENLDRLRAIVAEALEVEKRVDQIVPDFYARKVQAEHGDGCYSECRSRGGTVLQCSSWR